MTKRTSNLRVVVGIEIRIEQGAKREAEAGGEHHRPLLAVGLGEAGEVAPHAAHLGRPVRLGVVGGVVREGERPLLEGNDRVLPGVVRAVNLDVWYEFPQPPGDPGRVGDASEQRDWLHRHAVSPR